MSRTSIKLHRAALDEFEGKIVLRGVLSPDSFELLKVDEYQRDIEPEASIEKLIEAMENGSSPPDITLGMRGVDFSERDGCFYLSDNVYIIDGLQRTTAALRGIKANRLVDPRLGCMIHFNTTEPWERERFEILNNRRSKVSPNVLLHNKGKDYDSMQRLISLCSSDKFALKGKVSWKQRMGRGQLITARSLIQITLCLHNHLVSRADNIDDMAVKLQRLQDLIGPRKIRQNLIAFFEFIDSSFGLRYIRYAQSATQTKFNFLASMALVFSKHLNFWSDDLGHDFFIKSRDAQKLKKFEPNDPMVIQLSRNVGNTLSLQALIRDHFNSGKRNGHLKPRVVICGTEEEDGDLVEDDEEELLQAAG